MDTIFTRLEEASRVGDVVSLKTLLEEDKSLLERVIVSTSVRDNPLHIAALSGHADFVAEIMIRKPELAKELNGQGLSPLHLATANDHLLVVKELLKVGCDLCLLREEKEGLVPFHIAVIKGRTLVAKELLEACKEAMFELTYGGDTALHLVVKSNSFDMLEFLISQMQDLNVKDGNGNTILHLAVAKKQLCVIKLLLSNSSVDVNSTNSKGHTPLDVLFESQHESGVLLIGEMIRAAGGKTTCQPRTSQHFLLNSSSSHTSLNEPERDIEQGIIEPQEDTNVREHNADILVVVAILIATITFQAALNPPGGFFPDDPEHRNYDPKASGNPSNVAGRAVLGHRLRFFLVFDMIGLVSSVIVILLFLNMMLLKKMRVKLLTLILGISTMATALAFSNAVGAIFHNDGLEWVTKTTVVWLVLLMAGSMWVTVLYIIVMLKRCELYEPIKKLLSSWRKLFCSVIKRMLRYLRLNGISAATNRLKKSARLKRSYCIIMIICVLYINYQEYVSICRSIFSIMGKKNT